MTAPGQDGTSGLPLAGGDVAGRVQATAERSVAVGRDANLIQTGDHATARVIQVPADAFRPMAEVEAPPGIDNPEPPPGWFVGRETELARLNTALAGGGGSVVMAAVHGLGGVGKSSLAAHWVHTHAHGCAPIVWIHADSPAGVERGLAEFASRLQPALTEVLTVQDLAERGMQWLATHTGWLLILDNVENPADVSSLLGRARTGRVLITGRLSPPWQPGTTVISLDVLTAEEAEQLLIGSATAGGPRDLDGVTELCAALGYLPLAVEQVGAYLAHQRFTTPRAYLQLLTVMPGPTFDRAAAGTDPQRTIARIWRVTLDRITETEPAAVDLLRILAWYGPDNIPITLCRNPADQAAVDAALGTLAAYSMITLDPGGATLSIHRLVQAVARTPDLTNPDHPPDAIERARTRAAETLHSVLPDWRDPATWSAWRALLPHIDALTSHTTVSSEVNAIVRIRSHTGLFLSGQGLHTRALTHLHHTLADRERILGPEHPDTLTARGNLANAYRSAGRFAEAILVIEQNLTDCARILGLEHPDTLASRSNLASAYQSAGRTVEAIPLFEQNLTDCTRILGLEHPDTLISRGNLASAYQSAGRITEATTLIEHNLTDSERVLGPEHPDTLTSRGNLASAYQSAGRITEAIPLYEHTFADRERILGPEHPSTLTSCHNLASAYRSAGRIAEAIPLIEQNLANCERILGPEHPDTLTYRGNLAGAYRSAGRIAEAIPLIEQNLTDFERVLGPEHPDTLVSRGNLANAYQSAGRVGEAIPLIERNLADCERILGPEHPDTLTSRGNLAGAYQSAGRIAEAIVMFEQNLTDRERVHGPAHPNTLTAGGNLAGAYWSAGRIGEAIPLIEQNLANCERILGPEHPDTLTYRGNLAGAYRSAGRIGEAIPLIERNLADCERILGPEHPNTLTSRGNLAAARQRQASR